MTSIDTRIEEHPIPARDGYPLGATTFHPAEATGRSVVINGATAVPHRFYRRFASSLAERGFTVVTYDYRGVGASRQGSLRGFGALMRDWAFLDMAGVLDWIGERAHERVFFVGHSFGGQVAGMLDNGGLVDAMATFSSQSGHWRMQGGGQKYVVGFHQYVTMPMLSRAVGFMPWSTVGAGEDLPKGVATEWARWGRMRRYLLDDATLPLERFGEFTAPVLAYSFDDDAWGTAASVDAMMSAYPNLERRHIVPAEHGLDTIAHMGFFKPSSEALWADVADWFDRH